MANNTGHGSDAVSDIRSAAQQRMNQMQQKVPYRRQRNVRSFYGNNSSRMNRAGNMSFVSNDDSLQKEAHKEEETKIMEEDISKVASEKFKLPFGIGAGLEKYLEYLDTDKILIIAILAMIYKDGGNKKLMMALAYLLT